VCESVCVCVSVCVCECVCVLGGFISMLLSNRSTDFHETSYETYATGGFFPTVDNKMADGRSCDALATAATQRLWREITRSYRYKKICKF